MLAKDLVEGKKYKVMWKQQGGNYRWSKFVAQWVFIGEGNLGELLWSGRPVCGTQPMQVANFIDANEIDKNEKSTLPRRVGPA